MDKNKSDTKKAIVNKTIKVDDSTHRELRIYTASNGFRTMGEAVRDLLNRVSNKNS